MTWFVRGALVASALAFLCSGTSDLQAATVINRTADGNGQWDYVFYTHTGGTLSIDILANGWTGGPTGGIEDSYIEFYVNDGSPIDSLTGPLVGWNDDSDPGFATGGAADGSTSTLDSFLRLPGLLAGNYILAVGQCCHETPGTNARTNTESNLPGGEAGGLDYRVTFTSEVLGSEVPVPAALPLFATGLAALGLLARRRKKLAA